MGSPRARHKEHKAKRNAALEQKVAALSKLAGTKAVKPKHVRMTLPEANAEIMKSKSREGKYKGIAKTEKTSRHGKEVAKIDQKWVDNALKPAKNKIKTIRKKETFHQKMKPTR